MSRPLTEPPTEAEIAELMDVLCALPEVSLRETAQRLAFERDTLKRKLEQLADALVAVCQGSDVIKCKMVPDEYRLARKIIAARGTG